MPRRPADRLRRRRYDVIRADASRASGPVIHQPTGAVESEKMTRPHILFVDDDPGVLHALQQALKSDVDRWCMAFVDSGQAALDAFSSRTVDVVVCDLRMPGVDGATVLSQVRRHYPSTVRIVLSGHTEDELTLESLHATHRFLAKPVQVGEIREAIERSLVLRESLRNKALVKAMTGLDSVPALPQIYDELMTALAGRNTTSADIGEIIEQDIGLSATILKLVNSSFYGLFRHVGSPAQAAGLLGMDVIKNIALTEKLFSQFEGENIDIAYFVDLNLQSNFSGLLAARFARIARISRRTGDHCQIAGLLSRLGDLLISAKLDKHPLVTDGTLGSDLIGGYILGLWNMTDPIVDAVTYQHCKPPFATNGVTPTHVLHAIRHLQQHLVPGQPPEPALREELEAYLASFLPPPCATDWLDTYTGWLNDRTARAA